MCSGTWNLHSKEKNANDDEPNCEEAKTSTWGQRRWNSNNCETGWAVWDPQPSPQLTFCWGQRLFISESDSLDESWDKPTASLLFSHLTWCSNMFLSRLNPPPVTVSVCKLWHHLVVKIQTALTCTDTPTSLPTMILNVFRFLCFLSNRFNDIHLYL